MAWITFSKCGVRIIWNRWSHQELKHKYDKLLAEIKNILKERVNDVKISNRIRRVEGVLAYNFEDNPITNLKTKNKNIMLLNLEHEVLEELMNPEKKDLKEKVINLYEKCYQNSET